jgi:HEAT repeat protein
MRSRGWLALLLAISACSSDAGKKSVGSDRMVKSAELPARQREVLQAWQAGGVAWENQRERIQTDPELARFLVDNLVVQMVRSYDRAAIGSAIRPDSPFTRAQVELVRFPEASVPVLVELVLVRDGIVAFLAADTLKRIGAPAVDPVASKLGASEPEGRRRIAELLESLPESHSGEPALLERLGQTAEHDTAWIVRAQAARALGARAARREQKGYAAAVLTRALSDPDPEVQKTALEALSMLGDSNAIPALIRHLERAAREGDLAAIRATQAALRHLSGEKRDLDPQEWWDRLAPRRGAPSPAPR